MVSGKVFRIPGIPRKRREIIEAQKRFQEEGTEILRIYKMLENPQKHSMWELTEGVARLQELGLPEPGMPMTKEGKLERGDVSQQPIWMRFKSTSVSENNHIRNDQS